MGLFNILYLKNAACPKCQHVQDWKVQFKYGHCRQLDYNMFDELQWGGNDAGKPGAAIVLLEGIAEKDCIKCSYSEVLARIFVDDNKIVAACLVIKYMMNFDEDESGYFKVIE